LWSLETRVIAASTASASMLQRRDGPLELLDEK
jgi:hypothetical protein